MTRFDAIKEMDRADLANYLCEEIRSMGDCDYCPAHKFCCFGHMGMYEYLEEKYEDQC